MMNPFMNPKKEKKEDANKEGGHIYELKKNKYVVSRADKKDYVFVSYSSLNWKEALYEILYETCKKYGLRIYFDTNFDEGSDSWLTQFRNNMRDRHCKAVLAFLSPQYMVSYATLMEIMASQHSDIMKPVLPIVLGNMMLADGGNTGLGTERFPDSSMNLLWKEELRLFNELFNDIVFNKENNILGDKYEATKVLYTKSMIENLIPYRATIDFDMLKHNDIFWKGKGILDETEKRAYFDRMSDIEKNETGNIYLSKEKNHKIMMKIVAKLDKNNIDGVNKDYSDAIHDKLMNMGCHDVFDPELIDPTFGIQKPTRPEPIKQEPPKMPNSTAKPADTAACSNGSDNPVVFGNLWRYSAKGKSSWIRWDGESKNCTVLKGSEAGYEAPGFANLPAAKKLKDELVDKQILVSNRFVSDYECNKISTMINVLKGGSVSMPAELKNGSLRRCSDSDMASFDM